MPTLTQLEYALAVEKHKHFGKAARACHVSQPTLSMQIQKLEDELEIVLFDRIQKPVIATTKGREILEQAKQIIREHEKLMHIAKKDTDIISGDFRLAIIPTVASSLIPIFAHEFAKHFPQVNLYLEEFKTETILEELRNDRLDGAIMATPLKEEGLKEHPLYYEPFLLYISQEHPLLRKKLIREEDLDGSELWLLKDGNCFRDQVVRFCSILPEHDTVLRNVHFQGGSLETLKNIVQKSKGYTLIPSLMTNFLSREETDKHVRAFHSPVPTREISLVYRRDHWKIQIIQAIEELVKAVVPPQMKEKSAKNQMILEFC